MSLKWTDVEEIAIALCDAHPSVDPKMILFTDLHRHVCALPGFEDEPKRANERILEAIQQHWIDESED